MARSTSGVSHNRTNTLSHSRIGRSPPRVSRRANPFDKLRARLPSPPSIVCKGMFRMNRFAKSSLIVLCAIAPVSTLLAQDAGPPTPEQQQEQAILTRQGLLKVMGFYMGPLGGMLKNKVPFDAQLGGMIPDVFTFDTRKATNVKTKAQDGIWTNQADFKAKADDLVKAATAL